VGRGIRDEAIGGGADLVKDAAVVGGLNHLKAIVGTQRRVAGEEVAKRMQRTLEMQQLVSQLETTVDSAEHKQLMALLQKLDNAPELRGMLFDGDNWGDLYFLWSLERMAVIYNLTKIGDVDWHE